MIIHILWLTSLVWATSKCEPPVNNYLPPGGDHNGGGPSSEYGPPGRGNGIGRVGPGIGNDQNQDSYFPPGQSGTSNNPDSQYGPPSRNSKPGSQRTPQFGSPSQNGFGQRQNSGNSPNSQYGTPDQNSPQGSSRNSNGQTPFGNNGPQSSYSPPNRGEQGFGSPQSGRGDDSTFRQSQRPDSSYGPPPTGAIQLPGGTGIGRPEFQGMSNSAYSSPSFSGSPGSGQNGRISSSGSPSSTYGTPEFGGAAAGRGLARGSARGSDLREGDSDEPAKYEFSYDVDDAQTGTKFHHSEQRDGDVATGEYDVQLPDGRKQVVEYEAGLQGFKPQIRYEGAGGRTGSSFGSGSNQRLRGENQGYPRGGPGNTGESNQGGNNEFGYPQGRGQEDQSGGFQEPNSRGISQTNQEVMGYPRGGPGGGNEQGSRGYPGGRPEQAGQFDTSPGGNGIDSFNSGSQVAAGYPSGRPQGGNRKYPTSNGAGFSGGQRGRGNPSGGFQGSSGPGGDAGSDNGYPSGGPSGTRGSGY